jgi:hypothetical protein
VKDFTVRRLLYQAAMGPFKVTVFGIFSYTPNKDKKKPGSLIQWWYGGPTFTGAVEDLITSNVYDVVKILPGRLIEFSVYEVTNGIELECRTIYPVLSSCSSETDDSAAARHAEVKKLMEDVKGFGDPIFSSCGSFECGEHSPCLPPNNALRCPGGITECYQAEPPDAVQDCCGK